MTDPTTPDTPAACALSEENRALCERIDRYRVPTGDALHEHVSICASTMNRLLDAARDEGRRAPDQGEITREQLIDLIMQETTDALVEDGWKDRGSPNVLVQGCRFIRGHQPGYEKPEEAARGFAGFIADKFLALLSPPNQGEEVGRLRERGEQVEQRLSDLARAVRRVMDAREAWRSPDRGNHPNLVLEEAEAWAALRSVMDGQTPTKAPGHE